MPQMCQSCGMPLKQDPQHGGTEKDGSRSEKYCSYCYADGKFVGNFTSAQEMQRFCVEKMSENGMPKWLAWLLTRQIPKLERWRTAQQKSLGGNFLLPPRENSSIRNYLYSAASSFTPPLKNPPVASFVRLLSASVSSESVCCKRSTTLPKFSCLA